jgi:Sulfotransferase domain
VRALRLRRRASRDGLDGAHQAANVRRRRGSFARTTQIRLSQSATSLKLPQFIGIGPARTGTTWIHEAMQDVAWLPRNVKETRFFNERYQNGIAWYAWHFRHADASRPIGEVCPYFGSPDAIDRIAAYIPRCKIIVTFRDPADRAYSFYRLMRRYIWTRANFEETLATREIIAFGNRYAFLLAKWQERFGRDRVLVMLYDDLVSNPQAFLDQICDFVGAARVKLAGRKFRHRAQNAAECAPRSRHLAQNARHVMFWLQAHRCYRMVRFMEQRGVWRFCFEGGAPFPPLSAEVDARVRAQFRPEVEELERLIGRDLSVWKQPRGGRTAAPAPRAGVVDPAAAGSARRALG